MEMITPQACYLNLASNAVWAFTAAVCITLAMSAVGSVSTISNAFRKAGSPSSPLYRPPLWPPRVAR